MSIKGSLVRIRAVACCALQNMHHEVHLGTRICHTLFSLCCYMCTINKQNMLTPPVLNAVDAKRVYIFVIYWNP